MEKELAKALEDKAMQIGWRTLKSIIYDESHGGEVKAAAARRFAAMLDVHHLYRVVTEREKHSVHLINAAEARLVVLLDIPHTRCLGPERLEALALSESVGKRLRIAAGTRWAYSARKEELESMISYEKKWPLDAVSYAVRRLRAINGQELALAARSDSHKLARRRGGRANAPSMLKPRNSRPPQKVRS